MIYKPTECANIFAVYFAYTPSRYSQGIMKLLARHSEQPILLTHINREFSFHTNHYFQLFSLFSPSLFVILELIVGNWQGTSSETYLKVKCQKSLSFQAASSASYSSNCATLVSVQYLKQLFYNLLDLLSGTKPWLKFSIKIKILFQEMNEHEDAWWYCPFPSPLPVKANIPFNSFTAKSKFHDFMVSSNILISRQNFPENLVQHKKNNGGAQYLWSWQELNHNVQVWLRFTDHCLSFWPTLTILFANVLSPESQSHAAYIPLTFAHTNQVIILTLKNGNAKWKPMQALLKINSKQLKQSQCSANQL